MKKISIRNWAEEDRPREKLLLKGPTALSDAELIAILIGSGNANESAVELSQQILHSVANNLHALGKVSVKELTTQFYGIGQAKAISIIAALELGKRRNAADVVKRARIRSSKDAFVLLHPILCDLPHEELWVALMSRGGKILGKHKISQGGLAETSADMRLILRAAITGLASGIILFHNHPSGNLQPSTQDDMLTERLNKATRMMDISLLDHIIIADNQYYSYADEGRL